MYCYHMVSCQTNDVPKLAKETFKLRNQGSLYVILIIYIENMNSILSIKYTKTCFCDPFIYKICTFIHHFSRTRTTWEDKTLQKVLHIYDVQKRLQHRYQKVYVIDIFMTYQYFYKAQMSQENPLHHLETTYTYTFKSFSKTQ